jgi:ribosomal-protein-alanine N-acetyltransferase
MTLGWPARLRHGSIGLRPVRKADASAWRRLRSEQVDWLGPWEATLPPEAESPFLTHRAMIGVMLSHARAGRSMPFAVTWDEDLVGLVTVGNITWGSSRSATIGYWIARAHAGRGIIPTAVALVCDHLFAVAGVHRIEIAIRPENERSLRVVQKLGFNEIGLAPGYLHIAGQWRDHVVFQLVATDVQSTVLGRLESPQ